MDTLVETDADPASWRLARSLDGGRIPQPPASLKSDLGWRTKDGRWTVDGSFVRSMILDWMRRASVETLLGAELHTPLLATIKPGSPLQVLTQQFSDRIFMTGSRAERALRWNADPGVFAGLRALRDDDTDPVRLWEIGPAFRKNQSGERRGIQRMDEFTLHDHHALLPNSDAALAEYERLLFAQYSLIAGWSPHVALRFYAQPTGVPHAIGLAREFSTRTGHPALVTQSGPTGTYWPFGHVFLSERLYRMFNAQFDDTNPHRFGFAGADGERVLLHTSLGTVERMMLVSSNESAHVDGFLPLWLAPVQLTLVVTEGGTAAEGLARTLRLAGVRCELRIATNGVGQELADSRRRMVPARAVCEPSELDGGVIDLEVAGVHHLGLPLTAVRDRLSTAERASRRDTAV